MPKYICINGEYIKADNPVLYSNNRSFLYGDALFETIHANGTLPQFIDLHFERLTDSMRILSMNIPAYFNKEFITKYITGVLVRNKFFKGARVRLTVFRNAGGLYTPINNDISFLIESSKLETDIYALNKKGLLVDIYSEIKKPINILSGIKSTNALLFTMAGIYKNKNNLDECILINTNNKIIESISSNIFLIKGKVALTPSVKEGCLPGVMRQVVINLLRNEGYFVKADSQLSEQDIYPADECFITNAISGVRWISGFKQKRFFHSTSEMLNSKLNELAFPDY